LSSLERTGIVFVLLILIGPAVLALNAIDTILEPFAGFDFAGLYGRFSAIIDFTIFLVLFLGLTKATLAKRFTGRAGNYIVVAVSLALAFSLVLYEQATGFSLASFGPVAVVMLLSVTGLVLYTLVKQLGTNAPWSAATAFLISYFLMRAVAPATYGWLLANAPVVPAILSIAVLVSLIGLAVSVFSRFGSPVKKLEERVTAKQKKLVQQTLPEADMVQESEVVEAKLATVADKVYKDGKDLMANLREIAAAIEKHGEDPQAIPILVSKLKNILPDEHNIRKALASLREVDAALAQHDLHNRFQNSRRRTPCPNEYGLKSPELVAL